MTKMQQKSQGISNTDLQTASNPPDVFFHRTRSCIGPQASPDTLFPTNGDKVGGGALRAYGPLPCPLLTTLTHPNPLHLPVCVPDGRQMSCIHATVERTLRNDAGPKRMLHFTGADIGMAHALFHVHMPPFLIIFSTVRCLISHIFYGVSLQTAYIVRVRQQNDDIEATCTVKGND